MEAYCVPFNKHPKFFDLNASFYGEEFKEIRIKGRRALRSKYLKGNKKEKASNGLFLQICLIARRPPQSTGRPPAKDGRKVSAVCNAATT